ncbi:MAG: glycosyltransferase [Campylobacter sp.]
MAICKKRLIFTGFRNDAINVIKGFDIYVFPSHSEGLGTVLLEAMACEKPIVVFDKEPMNLLISHEKSGLCAKYLDANSLAQNIKKFLNDENLAVNCSKNALNCVKNYDIAELEKSMKILLESL